MKTNKLNIKKWMIVGQGQTQTPRIAPSETRVRPNRSCDNAEKGRQRS